MFKVSNSNITNNLNNNKWWIIAIILTINKIKEIKTKIKTFNSSNIVIINSITNKTLNNLFRILEAVIIIVTKIINNHNNKINKWYSSQLTNNKCRIMEIIMLIKINFINSFK